MKLIDEKGKLFGKVNLVDILVVVLVVALVAGAVVRVTSSRYNAAGSNPLTSKEQYCYVTVFSSLVVPEIAENLHEGDRLVANNAYTDAEVVSVKSEPAAYVGVDSNGKAVYSEHPIWKDVTVVVKEKVDPNDVILKVGNQEARIGYNYILKTQTVETNCKIRGIEFKDN